VAAALQAGPAPFYGKRRLLLADARDLMVETEVRATVSNVLVTVEGGAIGR